jgi:Protein of unknown function (DUF4232)
MRLDTFAARRLAGLSARRRAGVSARRLAIAAAMASAAALAPVASLAATGSPAAATAASTPACSTAGLVAWISYDQGAAGTFYYSISFTNLSGHACTLRGHPGVSAVGLSNAQVGARASWGDPGNAKLRTVKLGNGATATAVLAITDVGVFPAKACHPVMAAGLRVYPPGQSASKLIPYPFGACSARRPFMTAGFVQKPS